MSVNKEEILKSAIKVFSKYGYRGATMDDIALEAGIVKGTLYYNFKNKEDLFNEIIIFGIDQLRKEIKEVTKSVLDSKEKLRNCIRVQLEFTYRNKDFFKVILSQIWGEEARQKKLRTLVKEYINDIQVLVDEAVENNVIQGIDSLLLAHFFFATINSTALYDLIEGKDRISVDMESVVNFSMKLMEDKI